MAINLDISKAYEILEWCFLETMMRRLRFNEVWISRVMTCVTTISYLILVNDQPGPTFTLTKGLYQRDPISPYLYLIYMEALSSLLNEAKLFTKIKGVIVARISPSINHLFFADDIIAFCRAKVSDWQTIQEILETYETAAGQGINKHKSGIFFSSNTNRTARG